MTAKSEYLLRMNTIVKQIETLKALINKHSVMFGFTDMLNYGYAGDLYHVGEILDEAITFLKGAE